MIEKFQDAEQMEKSYENLEKEFTKKCQELSLLKKQLEEKVKEEPKSPEINLEFRTKASEFLSSISDAKEYSKEMSKILLTDKEILSLSDPFKVAYAMAKVNKSNEKIEEPKEEKIETTVEEVIKKPSVPLGASGFPPARIKPKFKSLDDAREELISRYFS